MLIHIARVASLLLVGVPWQAQVGRRDHLGQDLRVVAAAVVLRCGLGCETVTVHTVAEPLSVWTVPDRRAGWKEGPGCGVPCAGTVSRQFKPRAARRFGCVRLRKRCLRCKAPRAESGSHWRRTAPCRSLSPSLPHMSCCIHRFGPGRAPVGPKVGQANSIEPYVVI